MKADKIGITGWSSGGHLSALAGTTSGKTNGKSGSAAVDSTGTTPKYREQSDAVQAVADWFGPTDFLIMDSCGSTMNHDEEKSPESKLIGGKIQENKDKTTLANPSFYVSADTPPFLIFHGDKDPLVPLCQSEKLHARLVEKGVKSTLVVVPNGKHGPGVMIEKYYDQMIRFFDQYIK